MTAIVMPAEIAPTVHVPKGELGSFAMRRLHELIESNAPAFPIKSNVPTELVVRDSA